VAGERAKRVHRVVWTVLWLNLAVAAAKAAYALWAGSLAVGTDAVHSFLDAGANVIGLIALRLAAQPADPEHPYGHRKFEIVAATAIGVVIAVGVFELGSSAIAALLDGRPAAEPPAAGFAVVGGTWIVNMFVAAYEARAGRELGSPFLLADAGHTASDVIVTAGVLASLAAARYGIAWADAVGALVVLLFVARVAWGILTSNLGVLVDRVVVDPEAVRKVALAVPGVADCHRVRSRGTDLHAQVDLHLLIAGEIPLRQAHAVAHDVERALRQAFPAVKDVTIHMEPDDDDDEGL
jgi:cation diffusion facilitator family transporter